MNDFTKEELEEILDYCNWGPYVLGHSDFRWNLWNKIESMIDNYCEHEMHEIYGSMKINVCAKCGIKHDNQ